jgi:hypothetical protein
MAHEPAGVGNARHSVGRDKYGKGVTSRLTVPSFPSPCGLHEFAPEDRHGGDSPSPATCTAGTALTRPGVCTAARKAFGRGERWLAGTPRSALSPAALCAGARSETRVLARPALISLANSSRVKGPLDHIRDSQSPKNGDPAEQRRVTVSGRTGRSGRAAKGEGRTGKEKKRLLGFVGVAQVG